MQYKHGAYGELGEDKVKSAVQVDTVVAYVGTAPINLISNYSEKGLINTPIKLENMSSTQSTVGYSNNWETYTLCETFDCHFANSIENVGPIYIINVLDPDIHRKEKTETVQLTFKNGRAEYKNELVILDTFILLDKVLGVDYSVTYNYAKGVIVVESLNEVISGTIEASFCEIDIEKVTANDIIGNVTELGKYTGLQALSKLYAKYGVILNILAAPFWSENPNVYKAMISIASKINGHWDAFVNADIPIYDKTLNIAVDTIEKAVEWAKNNEYESGFSKIYWPQIQNGDKRYHLSTQATATMQRVDNSHNGIPMESPSNKELMCTSQYFGDSENEGFDQQRGNKLNEKGITTAVYWGGTWVLWGTHTAYYEFNPDEKIARYIFDVNIRMLMYITNGFQLRHGTQIAEPMNLNLQQSILIDEQEELDTLKGVGALIGTPTIEFLETENPLNDMMNGDFVWNVSATPTPPFKSGTARVCYTDEGFSAYFGGDE